MEKLLTLVAFLPFTVAAQTSVTTVTLEHLCADTKYTFQQLENKYGETPVLKASMPGNENMVISVWHNKENRTTTIVQTSMLQNLSCVLFAGEDARLIFKYD
jgi:hypothetical protein